MPSRSFITVVSGLPRSGTSMVMRMLEAGGIAPVTDGERAADEDNPLGYYELEAVKRLPAAAEWLAGANGKAVKVISALLEKLPPGHVYRVIFVERSLEEVLASQRRMLERRGEPTDRVPDDEMAAMFGRHVTLVLEKARARSDMRVLVLRHAEILANPRAAVATLFDFLGGGLDYEAMSRAVDPALWRQRSAR